MYVIFTAWRKVGQFLMLFAFPFTFLTIHVLQMGKEMSEKLTLASYGNIYEVPYLDQL